jgi:hypothetical protein
MALMVGLTILVFPLYFLLALCQPSTTPILPPSYPIAVKNPYLSGKTTTACSYHDALLTTWYVAWLPGNQTADLPTAVPQFWNGQQLTWSIIARIDSRAYRLFDVPDPVPDMLSGSLISAEYTSTPSS